MNGIKTFGLMAIMTLDQFSLSFSALTPLLAKG
jgi:hypothetical protein